MRLSTLPGIRTLKALPKEIYRAKCVAANGYSFYRLAADLVMYRFLMFGSLGVRNRERTIRLRDNIVITYRLNRGDIQSIREVWLENIYLLPGEPEFGRVFDLGANIGQASLYFAKKYRVGMILAVEPNPANAALTKRNLDMNNITARVVEAAVGPIDGTARFSDAIDSNSGRISDLGREVRMISIPTLCSQENIDSIDLLKMDIEGGEQALLSEKNEWLDVVEMIVAEFHPDCVDYPGLVNLITEKGFRRTTQDSSHHPYATETFTRMH